MSIALHGNLSVFRVPDLLTLINLSGRSGTLTLRLPPRDVCIVFAHGALKFATSNEARFRLGPVLERKSKISPQQSRQIDEAMQSSNEKFGQIAVRLGICGESQIRDCLKIQVTEIVYDTFLWPEGEFEFDLDSRMPEWAVTISADITNLIMEGARRIDEWSECLRLLPDSNAVYRVVPNPEQRDRISLSLDEWQILFLLDGVRSLDDLVKANNIEPLQIYRVIYGLLANNLIEVAPPEEVSTRIEVISAVGPGPEGSQETHRIATTPPLAGDDTPLLITLGTIPYSDLRDRAPLIGRLRISSPGQEPRLMELREAEYKLGRAADCEVLIEDPAVSGHHARFVRSREGYRLTDLGSQNGTQVNGAAGGPWLLRDGDMIRVGRSRLEFRIFHDVSEAVLEERP